MFRRALLLLACVAVTRAAPPPIEAFLRDATFDDIEISPDGSKVAALSKWKDHLNLFVLDVKTKKSIQLTRFDTSDVTGVSWLGNGTVLFSAFADDLDWAGLFAAAADGTSSRAIGGPRQTRTLTDDGQAPDEVLVTNNQRRATEPDVYRLNVRTNILHRVTTNPGNVRGWLADHTGTVRLGRGDDGRRRFLVYRENKDAPWREIRSWDFLEGDNLPVAFDAENRCVYLHSSEGRDTAALVLFDPATNRIIREIVSDPTYDTGTVILSAGHRLLGVSVDGEKERVRWQDPKFKQLQTLLDRELPDTVNSFYSMTDDETWVVVLAHSARDPGTFYLFNTQQLTLETLVRRAPWIDPKEMSEMRPIEYTARDGRVIHGYLTLPHGPEPRNLPMVVNPHGGPWVRDSWGYNPEVQFLASRGYAVLQMNFRGSTGYGLKHLQAGYGEWGLAMQDDITDGVKWAIAQGYADPKRVAIYGGSYGGFATMAGLAFTPDLYRCGINYVGVADIGLLWATLPPAWQSSSDVMKITTGNLKKDRDKLDAASPLKHIGRIRVPVFLAYGELDPRVDIKHGTRLASRLRAQGTPVELMVRADEGHGYQKAKNRLMFYQKMEEFLARNMR